MSNSEEEKYVPVFEGLSSISMNEIAACISSALGEKLGTQLECSISSMEFVGPGRVAIKLSVANKFRDDLSF